MGAGKILVVDDDPEVRMATRDFLASKGHDVTLAEDGVQALKLLATVKPDVVLLDVAMPEMDGMEALRRIVASYPNLPVIMVTANADIEITSKVLQLGAADYVPKPFDLDYLDQAINIQLSAGRGAGG
ncbi:MAG TPA: response regulator [Methylomirabilota bacterium]|jgi:DNA-binding response OmpR family regulator|nr:response regulator [Methylomirabilota bacterium]HYR37680.1 response regulator [Methylomirabilota bacterium]